MSASNKVLIIDYGMGNLYNLFKVLVHLGADPVFCTRPEDLDSAPKVILPGVGAFGDGIRQLKENGMDQGIRKFVRSGSPLLGVCLGMQLLLDESLEGGQHPGLGIVKGRVTRFLDPLPAAEGYKIPHIGWNRLLLPDGKNWQETILSRLHPEDYVYFVHSFTVGPADKKVLLAQTHYGRQDFCSVLHQDNVYGCQFHPEISGAVGLNILQQFLSIN